MRLFDSIVFCAGFLMLVAGGGLSGCATPVESRPGPGQGMANGVHLYLSPDWESFTQAQAEGMRQSATGKLAPVYAPLADQIVSDFDLANHRGIGVDVGGGPGTLCVALAERTPGMYWINTDVNTYCFSGFAELADDAGVAHRVGALFADVKHLPFRENYADVIVSRGSLQFWGDREQGFREILRVLKPGGGALIGRGLAESMSVESARSVRDATNGGPQYDADKLEAELRRILKELGVKDFEILRPRPEGAEDVNYGVWARFRKP